jgi:hypothetical protein
VRPETLGKTEVFRLLDFRSTAVPKLKSNAVRSYRLHKQSGQAIVTLSGRDHLLGAHATEESREKYNRLIAQWIAGGRRPLDLGKTTEVGLTMSEGIVAFWGHAQEYYRHLDGTQTSELGVLRYALGPLRRLYGRTPAAAFTPRCLNPCNPAAARRTEKVREMFTLDPKRDS